MALAIRQATEEDLVFVAHSWAKSYQSSHKAGIIAMEDYMAIAQPQLRKVLSREGVSTLVAYQTEAKSTVADIAGYLAFERDYERPVRKFMSGKWEKFLEKPDCPLVHFFYVKKHYRRLGVWTKLMKESGIDAEEPMYITCESGIVSALLPRAQLDPLIARFPKHKETNDRKEQETSSKETRVKGYGGRVRRRHRHREG